MLTVCPLTSEDVSVFASMVVRLYREDPGPVRMDADRARRQARDLLDTAGSAWPFLLRDEGSPVGHAILASFWSNEFGGRMVFVDELYVNPDARGRGLGGAFLDWALDWADRQGFVRVELEVNRANRRAMDLYTRHGFVAEDREVMGRAPLKNRA